MIHISEQDKIVATKDYEGKSADAAKKLTKSEIALLQDILTLQDDMIQLQNDIQQKFTDDVDSVSNANLEYDIVKEIENDFKDLYTEFCKNTSEVEKLAERCESYTKYGSFSGVDFSKERQYFVDFCGGDEENCGYLNSVLNKLIMFDYETQGMILDRGLDNRICDISNRLAAAIPDYDKSIMNNNREEQLRITRATNEKYARISFILGKEDWTDDETKFIVECYLTATDESDLDTLNVIFEGLTVNETLRIEEGTSTSYCQRIGLNKLKVARITDCMIANYGVDEKSMKVLNLHNAASNPLVVSGSKTKDVSITVEKCDCGFAISTTATRSGKSEVKQDIYWDDEYYDKIYKNTTTQFQLYKNQYELLKDDKICAVYNYHLKWNLINAVDYTDQAQFDYLVSDVVDEQVLSDKSFCKRIRENSKAVQNRCDDFWNKASSYDEQWYHDNDKLSQAMGYLVMESILDEKGLNVRNFIYDDEQKQKIVALESLILSNPPQGVFSEQLLNRLEGASSYPEYKGERTTFDLTDGHLETELLTAYYVNHDAYVAYSDHAGRQMVSLSLDFFPIISAGKMLLEGLIGKDLITGDELSDEQMALTVVTVVCGGLLSSSALMPDALYGLEEVTVASEQSIIEAQKLAKTTVGAEKQITKVHVVEQSAIKVEKAEKTAAELEVVEKYGASSGSSAYKGGKHSLSNYEARKWYLEQEAKIPDMIDSSLSLKEQAKQAFNLRNKFRTEARELMAARETAESLYKTDKNLTWEQLVEKQKTKGLSGDDIYKEIIASSQRSRKSVNKSLGLE